MFKCLNFNCDNLPKHSENHSYYTRNNNKFIAPKCEMKKLEMSMNFESIKVWNKLPADIRILDSLNVFMNNSGNHYLSLYYLITNVFFIPPIRVISLYCYQQ